MSMSQENSALHLDANASLALTPAEQQALAYQRTLYAAERAAQQRLSALILGLVGVQCIKECLPEELFDEGEESTPAVAPSRLILCEHLEPRYIKDIVAQVEVLKAQGERSLSHLTVAITTKALQDLDVGTPRPAWVVPDDQNATYWRNNIAPGSVVLSAISMGENEDTLSNIPDRISSESLKQHLAQKTVLTEVLIRLQETLPPLLAQLQAQDEVAKLQNIPRVLGELLTNPLQSDLAITLSALIETLSLKPSDVSDYLAAVLLRLAAGAPNLRVALGETLPTFQLPRQAELFTNTGKPVKSYTKDYVARKINATLKERPTLFNFATASGLPLENFKQDKLTHNLQKLLSLPQGEAPMLSEWEAGLLKQFVAEWAQRETLFTELCTIEWEGKLALFFNDEPQATRKKSLYERTMDMFQENLTNEAKLSAQEESTIELVQQKLQNLTRDQRNELNDLYQRRRAIFDQNPSISKEWERYIYHEDIIAEPNFLLSLSKAMLNLVRSVDDDREEELVRLNLTLDGTIQQICAKNYEVMTYFSLRYGAFLRHLAASLNGLLVVDYGGSKTTSKHEPEQDAELNPLFDFDRFLTAHDAKRSTKSTDKDTTIDLVLTPTYRIKDGAMNGAPHSALEGASIGTPKDAPDGASKGTAGELVQGKPFKIKWQLRPERVSFMFRADLENLVARPELRCGVFEHEDLSTQGSEQELSLYNNATLLCEGEPRSFFGSDDPHCNLSARWQQCWDALVQRRTAQPLDPNNQQAVRDSLHAINTRFTDFATQYHHCLEQLKAYSLQPSACHALAHSYSALHYELLHSPLNAMGEPALKELLALTLQVGMAYRKSGSRQNLSYAIATPFTVEALRSHACKLERIHELITDIFTKPISINDRAVFLASLAQDLNYYDAPELCLVEVQQPHEPVARYHELIATQGLGGYTLYVAAAKLQQDLGTNLARPSNKKGRGRPKKSELTNLFIGSQGGGGCTGIGGANASSNSSEIALNAIGGQISAYLEHHPYPLSQCTLVLSHCPAAGFALELYRQLKTTQREKWPGTHLNLVILCPDIRAAQDVFSLFETERFALKQSLEGPEFVKAVSVTILLQDHGDSSAKRGSTLNDYLDRMSLQSHATSGGGFAHYDRTAQDKSNERFAQIGLMVHAFDAKSVFKFSAPQEVPLVSDEVHYQPSLINMVAATPNTAMGRFVISPVLPLSKILLLHSIYYLKSGSDEAFRAAQSKLQQALASQEQAAQQAAQAASALGLTQMSAQTIPTPLYVRCLDTQSQDSISEPLEQAVEQIHQSCDAVFYLDDLLDRKQLKAKGIRVLYYQKLPQNSINFLIATKVQVEAKTRQFLMDLVAACGLDINQQAQCLNQVAAASLNISGRLLMHAQLRRQHAYELMGVVLTGFMAQSMMDLLAEHYHAQAQTYRTLVYLDDYKAIFAASGSQRSKRLADLLGIQIIKQGDAHYLLNLVVLESKFLEIPSTDAANKSLQQTRETTELLQRAFKRYASRHSLDRKQWLARIADMLVDNSDQLAQLNADQKQASAEFSRIQQLIRNGQVDILLKGCSLVFARTSAGDDSLISAPLCESTIKPKLDKSSPESGFPLVQAKFTGQGVDLVLQQFHKSNAIGTRAALQALAAACHDNTIIEYCCSTDPVFLLPAQLPQAQELKTPMALTTEAFTPPQDVSTIAPQTAPDEASAEITSARPAPSSFEPYSAPSDNTLAQPTAQAAVQTGARSTSANTAPNSAPPYYASDESTRAQPAAQAAAQYGDRAAYASPAPYRAQQAYDPRNSTAQAQPATQPTAQSGYRATNAPTAPNSAPPYYAPNESTRAQPTTQPAAQSGYRATNAPTAPNSAPPYYAPNETTGAQPAAQPTAQSGYRATNAPTAPNSAPPYYAPNESSRAQPAAQPAAQYGYRTTNAPTAPNSAPPYYAPNESSRAQPAAQPTAQSGYHTTYAYTTTNFEPNYAQQYAAPTGHNTVHSEMRSEQRAAGPHGDANAPQQAPNSTPAFQLENEVLMRQPGLLVSDTIEPPSAPATKPAPHAPTRPAPAAMPVWEDQAPTDLAPERSKWLATVPRRAYNAWRPPVAELLPRSHYDHGTNLRYLNSMADKIDATLQEFGVLAKVDRNCYVPGPIITGYTIRLDYGETVRAIERILDEMPRKLGVRSVRFDTNTVRLEVPNEQRQTIALGDVLVSPEFNACTAELPLALGLTPDGSVVIRDLVSGGPHLLVAGTTGSGKSVGLNAILLSLIAKHSPQELRLIIIDPKREFNTYARLPHMLLPPIKDVTEDAMRALRWCIEEMERRVQLFDDLNLGSKLSTYNQYLLQERARGQRHLNYLNSAQTTEYLEPLPRIVVLVDEFNDLMAQNRAKRAEFEALIERLAGKCRAAGIHLIFATQSPRAEVVTGLIKSNLPARIAFKVSDYRESKIILDETGAETLLGRGDMLHRFSDETTQRAHGAYVTESEISAMVEAWHQRYGDPEYLTQLIPQVSGSSIDLAQVLPQAQRLCAEAKAQGRRITERDLRHQLNLDQLTAQKLCALLQAQGLL